MVYNFQFFWGRCILVNFGYILTRISGSIFKNSPNFLFLQLQNTPNSYIVVCQAEGFIPWVPVGTHKTMYPSPVNVGDSHQFWTVGTFPAINYSYDAYKPINQLNLALQRPKRTSDELKEIDANFLFPTICSRVDCVPDQLSEARSSSRSPRSEVESHHPQKVFNVVKVPKVAFQLVSRQDLCRPSDNAWEIEYEEPIEDSSDSSLKRKQIFGGKRDDLYYKTICRDVRRFMQLQFQTYLGEQNISDFMKQKIFVEVVQGFLHSVVNSRTNKTTIDDEDIWVLATFVSACQFQKWCSKNSRDLSLKIHNSLFRFTKAKLRVLWKMSAFRNIYKFYYISVTSTTNPGSSFYDYARRHKTMKSNFEGYKFALEDILRLCNFN